MVRIAFGSRTLVLLHVVCHTPVTLKLMPVGNHYGREVNLLWCDECDTVVEGDDLIAENATEDAR